MQVVINKTSGEKINTQPVSNKIKTSLPFSPTRRKVPKINMREIPKAKKNEWQKHNKNFTFNSTRYFHSNRHRFKYNFNSNLMEIDLSIFQRNSAALLHTLFKSPTAVKWSFKNSRAKTYLEKDSIYSRFRKNSSSSFFWYIMEIR